MAAQSTIPICWSLAGLRLLPGTNCFAPLPPTYKGLSFLNDSVFKRRTGDIWVGSAKHNSNLLVPGWSSSASSGTELLRLLPPTYKGLSFLNDSVSKRRTGDIWVGSAKHNSNLLVPVWSSSVFLRLGPNCFASLSATNCWVRKSACLYNNCQYSGVGSDWGRGDLPNVIFNSLDILHVFVSIFVIRKGPTLFSLLPQSRSSHYPHSEDYRRIAFPPTNIVSIILRLMTSERVQPLFAQICWTVTFDGTGFKST